MFVCACICVCVWWMGEGERQKDRDEIGNKWERKVMKKYVNKWVIKIATVINGYSLIYVLCKSLSYFSK
jgi:hypothetical protein